MPRVGVPRLHSAQLRQAGRGRSRRAYEGSPIYIRGPSAGQIRFVAGKGAEKDGKVLSLTLANASDILDH